MARWLHVGDKVHWADPCKEDYESEEQWQEQYNQVRTVTDINNSECIACCDDGFGYLEAYYSELKLVKQ